MLTISPITWSEIPESNIRAGTVTVSITSTAIATAKLDMPSIARGLSLS